MNTPDCVSVAPDVTKTITAQKPHIISTHHSSEKSLRSAKGHDCPCSISDNNGFTRTVGCCSVLGPANCREFVPNNATDVNFFTDPSQIYGLRNFYMQNVGGCAANPECTSSNSVLALNGVAQGTCDYSFGNPVVVFSAESVTESGNTHVTIFQMGCFSTCPGDKYTVHVGTDGLNGFALDFGC
jgi:hypothetical protein